MPTLAPPAPTTGLAPLDPEQIAGLIKLGERCFGTLWA
jgi:hypothetical protein